MTKVRATTLCATAALLLLLAAGASAAHSQTFQVLHNFNAGTGANPTAGLAIDRAGNLYGTAPRGGGTWYITQCQLLIPGGCGVVFKLARHGSGWVYSMLYAFASTDGGYPFSGVTVGPNGSVYGATGLGGNCSYYYGCGVIFNVHPGPSFPVSVTAPWSEDILYDFYGEDDGGPYSRAVIFGSDGALYGTTPGGHNGNGNIYQLARSGSSWTESVLYTFSSNVRDGKAPTALTFDSMGNLYGATNQGGNYDCRPFNGCGTVYQLTQSNGVWTKTILHVFNEAAEGGGPAAVIVDPEGNIYGGTNGDEANGGIVYELSPAGGAWRATILYQFPGYNGWGPYGALTLDAAGNLYGTTYGHGPSNYGTIFKLTHSGGGWTFTDLYDFQGLDDGCYPEGNVVLDASGNLYGTTSDCGQAGNGTIWEVTP